MTSIEFAIEPELTWTVCLYSAFMTTANMKYRANIKNDNKNMKSAYMYAVLKSKLCWNICTTCKNTQCENKVR